MARAVQGLFADTALLTSAPAAKPSSPQAQEGGGFAEILDQARPQSTQASSSSNSDSSAKSNSTDSIADGSKSDKKSKRTSHTSKSSSSAKNATRKAAPTNEDEDDAQAETDTAKAADPAAQTAAAEEQSATPPPEDPEHPLPKVDRKKTDESAAADAQAQQAATAADPKRVQAIGKQKEQRQSEGEGKDSVKRAVVRAIEPGDAPDDDTTASASATSTAASASAADAVKHPAQTPKSTKVAPESGKATLAIQPHEAREGANNHSTASAALQAIDPADVPPPTADVAASTSTDEKSDATTPRASAHSASDAFAEILAGVQSANPSHTPAPGLTADSRLQDAPPAPEAQFAQANHAQIVSGIHGQLLPSGGTMQIRLDPPELGALSLIVRIHEGVMTASFETSNDQATRLLSHSLGQLKASLESQGISVGQLHVQQSPRDQQSNSSSDERSSKDNGSQDSPPQREQQRREMLRRMWRRLSGSNDPLDLVA